MHRLVAELWQAHQPAVLLVTHDVDEAILLANRALVLVDGKIGAEFTIALPYPRDHAQPGFATLRRNLLSALGVETAPPPAPAKVSQHALEHLATALLTSRADPHAIANGHAEEAASHLAGGHA